MSSSSDTIFALSSGAPPAAIGVIRVSGPAAATAHIALAGSLPAPRRATLTWLVDPDSGERLDRALTLWFPGPGTATGEDLAELHIHGGRAVVAAVQAVLARLPGLRPAEPGEFTRRAFTNGTIDLAEAEGLADLLAAETDSQRRNALALAGGVLSRNVAAWQAEILALAASIEAMLDFSDEDDVPDDQEAPIRAAAGDIADAMAILLARPSAERLRDGVRVVLAGPANAGKSTLLNALAGRDAAITAASAGTTRDLIEVPVALGGVAFLLTDTAGLRASEDVVERIGIDRAIIAIDAADILLWLGAPDECPDHGCAIIVHPRCDLPDRRDVPADADLALSAVTGEGLETLVDMLVDRARNILPREDEIALNKRQQAAIFDAAGALRSGLSGDNIVFAESLRAARAALDRLTGRAGVEDMLDMLFGRFCIGK